MYTLMVVFDLAGLKREQTVVANLDAYRTITQPHDLCLLINFLIKSDVDLEAVEAIAQ